MRTPWVHAVRASLVLSLALAAPDPARALQIVEAIEGQTVLAKISARELTRITIERARVRAVTGLEGQLLLEKDDHTGSVYVRPTDTSRPVNVFVTARLGPHLRARPAARGHARRHDRAPRSHAARGERGERPRALRRPREAVKSMVVALATGELVPDLDLREVGREIALWREARFFLERSYVGRRIVGDRYRLTNISPAPMRIAEAELFKPGVLGIAVERLELAPGESTSVYVVREREAAE